MGLDASSRRVQETPGHRELPPAPGSPTVGGPVADRPAADPPPPPNPSPPAASTESAAARGPNPGDWGRPVDPDGDTAIELDATSGEIKFGIPGTPHVLGAEIGRMNAPRVLRPVRGDFAAGVVVNGVSHPAGRATLPDYAAFHGAGLLLWQDERNYLRLEIAAEVRRGRPRPYANFELRRGGVLASSQGIEIKDGSSRLLLVRRGGVVRGAFGRDGTRWTWFAPVELGFDGPSRIGGAAINSATKPLYADLQSLRVVPIGDAGESEAVREASGLPAADPDPSSQADATGPSVPQRTGDH
ncbi:hypothetical protein OJF2_09980 [Aquisphaera giovannonii]|uniref:Uncharacterized protein n=1 Tax=Aquisphaera giovannonii TaxID=406548 RepID=A0A5B9VXD3_9BACT|nr:DUF1349 domain-containing protein [Aquisphaera giovannonii]QEH32521.1 hypothetical protein OJF2_09980 [Aquisphaera giovannonii]